MNISKYINTVKVAALLLTFTTGLLTACSPDNDAFITASEDDEPRILQPSFAEWTDGVPGIFKSFSRATAFSETIVVTPAQYTTVEWFIDGEKIHEGNTISDYYFLAGTYELKVVATTTKGKTTSRTGLLDVYAVEGDPNLDNSDKARWFNPGATKTISGQNLEGIIAVTIGGIEAPVTENDGSSLTFIIPANVPLGFQRLILKSKDMEYGCGSANVTNQEWVDPGVEKITIWEGAKEINWGESNISLNCKELGIEVGNTLRVYYDLADMPEGYHAARLATGPSWLGDVLPQFDLPGDATGQYEVNITEEIMNAINADGGEILVVGYGYKVTKVELEKEVIPAETTIWEGAKEINWGDSNIVLNCAELGIKVGSTVTVYYDLADMPEGYHAARLATGPSWLGDVLPQFDLPGDATGQYSVVITEDVMNAINADGGEILVVGYGYKVTKVTMM